MEVGSLFHFTPVGIILLSTSDRLTFFECNHITDVKQPDVVHKYDLNGYACDNDNDTEHNDDDYNINNDEMVGPIIAATQKQQAKKTARLLKSNTFLIQCE